MSRIGNAPISIPDGVTVDIKGNSVTVKGKLGELTQEISELIKPELNDNVLVVNKNEDTLAARAQHGLSRALLFNMVEGVSNGWKIEQELVGVGFRANATGQELELSLGFSHHIVFQVPKEVKVATETAKGQNPKIILTSFDKQLVGQVAAKIRSLRKPEPYKGKGIRFTGEEVRRKAGKSAGK